MGKEPFQPFQWFQLFQSVKKSMAVQIIQVVSAKQLRLNSLRLTLADNRFARFKSFDCENEFRSGSHLTPHANLTLND